MLVELKLRMNTYRNSVFSKIKSFKCSDDLFRYIDEFNKSAPIHGRLIFDFELITSNKTN